MKDTNKLTIEYIPVAEIIPYAKNPRKNDKAVDLVANSIQEFGFKNPLILDKNNEIITGHTRLKAAIKLGLTEVPVMWAEDLSPEQVKAFRIMDNKSGELATWDFDLLKDEIAELKESKFNVDLTGFTKEAREVIDISENLEDVPDVDLEGALKKFNKVIIVGMMYDEHENAIREFLELPTNRKTMKSTEFIEILKKKVK